MAKALTNRASSSSQGTLDMLIEANQRAKDYRLTASGKAQLSREQDRCSQLVRAIGRIMNPAPAGEE